VVSRAKLLTGLRVTGSLCAVVIASWAVAAGGIWAWASMRPPGLAHGNDTSAWASLRNICSSEREFRRGAHVDMDGDGVGEFGTLAELSGAVPLPDGHVLNPPVLSGAFRSVDLDGSVPRSGYRIRVFLPAESGDGVREPGFALPPAHPRAKGEPHCSPSAPVGPPSPRRAGRDRVTDRVDPARASTKWCAYAWPVEYERTGRLTFVIDQDGNELRTDDPRYSGDNGPLPGAAFAGGGALSIVGDLARGVRAQDGNLWTEYP
jgi:hypothetical protein